MRILGCVVAVMALAAIAAVAPAADKVDVTGEWDITIESPQGTFTPSAVFQQDGEKLTGTYKGRFGESKLEGTVKEKAIQWKVTISIEGQAVNLLYKGTVESDDTMKGSVELGEFGSAEWKAKRKKK